jgi:hypothetical protein
MILSMGRRLTRYATLRKQAAAARRKGRGMNDFLISISARRQFAA